MSAPGLIFLALGGTALVIVAQEVLSAEATGWMQALARTVVRRAVRRLPEPCRERYLEEWLADVATFGDRPLSALFTALRIYHHAPATGKAWGSTPQGPAVVETLRESVDRMHLGDPRLIAAAIARLILRTEPPQTSWSAVVEEMRSVTEGQGEVLVHSLARSYHRVCAVFDDAREPRLSATAVELMSTVIRQEPVPAHRRAPLEDLLAEDLPAAQARAREVADEVFDARKGGRSGISRGQAHAVARTALMTWFPEPGRDLETHVRVCADLAVTFGNFNPVNEARAHVGSLMADINRQMRADAAGVSWVVTQKIAALACQAYDAEVDDGSIGEFAGRLLDLELRRNPKSLQYWWPELNDPHAVALLSDARRLSAVRYFRAPVPGRLEHGA